MKVLGISGSMRRDGNTTALVQTILERCRRAGIGTEFISLAGKVIHPCLGCEECKEKKCCVIANDDWSAIIERVLACEVLVIGSPTYYYDVCGQLKNFIDRTYSLYHDRKLAGRRGVAVAVCADRGSDRALETIEAFLNTHEFSFLGGVRGKGYEPGAVLKDHEAIARAQAIGNRIVGLLCPGD
jgi:multimeric flavodoxin WrbA